MARAVVWGRSGRRTSGLRNPVCAWHSLVSGARRLLGLSRCGARSGHGKGWSPVAQWPPDSSPHEVYLIVSLFEPIELWALPARSVAKTFQV
jgi:hypothetical protein